MIKRHTVMSLNPSTAIFYPTERNKKQPKHSGNFTEFSFLTRDKENGRLINCKDWVNIWVAICSLSSVINEHKTCDFFVWGRNIWETLDLSHVIE